jgi:hypothetical protein
MLFPDLGVPDRWSAKVSMRLYTADDCSQLHTMESSGDMGTGDMGTGDWGHGDMGTWGHGDMGRRDLRVLSSGCFSRSLQRRGRCAARGWSLRSR